MLLPYGSLFISAFLSATILPMASEGVLGIMIYQGFNPWICLAVATAGNTLGGTTNYIVGKLGNWQLLEKYFGVKETKTKSWKKYADKYGAYTALLGWLPFIGDPIIVALGFFRVSFWSVLFWMTLGKLGRYAFVIKSIYFIN